MKEEIMKFAEISEGEKSRTYHYQGGGCFTILKAARICVRPSGTHRIETEDGKKYIVSAGWMAIEIVADNWSI